MTVIALRVELLRLATAYGTATARPESVELWRSWLDELEAFWVAGKVAGLGISEVGDEAEAARMIHAWVGMLRSNLDAAELGTPVFDVEDPSDTQERSWHESLERLADRARCVEALGFEPLREERGRAYESGYALLGAIEDSLVLSLSSEPAIRRRRTSSEAVLELLRSAHEDGLWGAPD